MADVYTSRHIKKVLLQHKFCKVSQKGSHAKFRCISSGCTNTVILPMGKHSIPHGTFRSIVRQSGLDITDFKKN